MESGDKILDKYIKNNLNFWKNKNLNETNLINLIQKYKLPIAKIRLTNGKVIIEKKFNTKGNKKLSKAIVFLNDIVKLYPQIDTKLYLNIRDTLYDEKINIYNVNGIKGNKKKLNDFVWGVSKSNPNYIRIVDSTKINEYNDTFPIFCFERNRYMNGILFPTFGADNNNIKQSINIDNFSWGQKDIDEPIFRGKNICCDVSNLDKLKLINFSYLNNKTIDFKFCSSSSHPLWDKYIVSESLLKFCKNIDVINEEIDIKKFRDYFSRDNFVSFDFLFRHKYIVTVGSAKNRKFYLSNSCILERKFKNKEYFHEDIFEDMVDIVYFTEDNLFDKLSKLKENNYKLSKKLIENRKNKFNQYLHYPNLVKWYGLFLLEYQKLF